MDNMDGYPAPACLGLNDNSGSTGARISALFVILITSMFGAMFPVFARRASGLKVPEWVFFIAKYFGSGVIIATAFIHLLAPACDALTNDCLTGEITEYDWAEGIALMMVFVMFFLELIVMRYGNFEAPAETAEEASDANRRSSLPTNAMSTVNYQHRNSRSSGVTAMGDDHFGHQRDHKDNEVIVRDEEKEMQILPDSYAAQLTAIFILEFGVIFHSVFVGLTLAVSGDEFKILYVVLVFHQMFEGLGLGSRLATVPWPKSKRWTPYIMAMAYGLTTPVAIAIGLGVRTTYNENSQTGLIVNGVFDALSAGILLYVGLVELMAHEFMFSPQMTKAPMRQVMAALALMVLGAGLMALLGKWA